MKRVSLTLAGTAGAAALIGSSEWGDDGGTETLRGSGDGTRHFVPQLGHEALQFGEVVDAGDRTLTLKTDNEAVEVSYEEILRGQEIVFYLGGHDGKPMSTRGLQARAVIQDGGKTSTITLTPTTSIIAPSSTVASFANASSRPTNRALV